MDLSLFALHASREYGERVARALGVALAPHEEREFEDGEHKARPLESVRGRDVYVIHSLYAEAQQNRIMGCRVMVEKSHKHHRRGNHYHVRVDVTVPGSELVASREPDEHHAYTDVYVAIRDAFDTLRRQLEDYARQHDQRAKVHAAPPHGRIVELHPAEQYGRIETPDGRLVYFHRNSVVGADFDRLQVGAEVRFDEEAGERGPQASTVHVVGKHHIVG